ncbi:hypothetical protein K439DRAFT_1371401, partial [Ramaria rubella]
LKQCTIEHILSTYRHTGHVISSPKQPRGQRQKLDGVDNVFLLGSITETNDIYLDELKANLEECCGTEVSLSMVWRALKKSGFTMKKV